jgi:DNA-binding transcriptional regulator YiaG
MKSEKKIKKMIYNGFGFPVVLNDVPAKVVRGNVEPIINYKTLGAEVIEALCQKETPLTGNQVKFIRQYFELSLRDFAELFGLSHPAIFKWENHNDDFAEISPATEKTLRLEALFRLGLKAKEFYQVFTNLKDLASRLQKSDADHEEPLKLAI